MEPDSGPNIGSNEKHFDSGSECLGHDDLVKLLEERRSQWPSHVHECEHCSAILRLLMDPLGERRRFMAELISQNREDAESAYKRKSILGSIAALFFINQPKWSKAALTASILLLGVFGFFTYREYRVPLEQPARVVNLEKDNYPNDFATVQLAMERLPDTLSGNKQIEQINDDIRKVNDSTVRINELYRQNKMPGERRAEFTAVLFVYQGKLSELRNHPIAQPKTLPDVVKTPDTESLATVLKAVESSKKNTDPDTANSEFARTVSTLKEMEVVSVDNSNTGNESPSKVVTLRYRMPSSNQTDDAAKLESAVNSKFDTKVISVKVLPAFATLRRSTFSKSN